MNDTPKMKFNNRRAEEAMAPAHFDFVGDRTTGKFWVLHDKPFTDQNRIDRAEYDPAKHLIRFISRDGGIQYLGAAVKAPLQRYARNAKEITAILTDRDGNINNLFVVPLRQLESIKTA